MLDLLLAFGLVFVCCLRLLIWVVVRLLVVLVLFVMFVCFGFVSGLCVAGLCDFGVAFAWVDACVGYGLKLLN